MDTTQVTEIFREGIGVAIKLGAPILLMCMLVGIIIAIFQAVTQIHEQTLSFVLKLLVVVLVLTIAGGWMLSMLHEYTLGLFELMLA